MYTLVLLFLMGGGALFLYLLFDSLIDLVLPGFYFISYYSIPVLMLYTSSFLILTTLLKLSRSWFMLLRLERNTSTHQLQSLQSQINPHFLLNSLQTIYALSLNRDKHTPEVVLKLGDILKYTLYETEQATIALEDEWKLIANYIDMYRYRVENRRVDIAFECIGEPGRLKIAPMLLIPFIENCFKHGLGRQQEKASIHIALKVQGSRLDFSAVNSTGKAGGPDASPAPERRKGIGIENTRQRLDLLYPGKHRLEIREEGGEFSVHLKIQLDD
jgi:sensor histidine kinase YesM